MAIASFTEVLESREEDEGLNRIGRMDVFILVP